MSQVTLENLVSVKEAAEELGLTQASVTRYCLLGELRATKFGRAWMIDRESLEEFKTVDRKRGNPQFGPDFWPSRKNPQSRA